MADNLGKIPGTYCPVCGDVGLFGKLIDGKLWAYCGTGGDGPEENHTAYMYTGSSVPPGHAKAKSRPKREVKVKENIVPGEGDE